MKTKRLKVLIVDDNTDYFKHVKNSLGADYRCFSEICDLTKALVSITKKEPDVIIIDGMASSQSGFDICRVLKDKSETEQIPIILIGENDELKNKLRGFLAGAQKYLKKYQDEAELPQCINCLLRKKCDRENLELCKKQQTSMNDIFCVTNN